VYVIGNACHGLLGSIILKLRWNGTSVHQPRVQEQSVCVPTKTRTSLQYNQQVKPILFMPSPDFRFQSGGGSGYLNLGDRIGLRQFRLRKNGQGARRRGQLMVIEDGDIPLLGAGDSQTRALQWGRTDEKRQLELQTYRRDDLQTKSLSA
jgi:hypothetical protein